MWVKGFDKRSSGFSGTHAPTGCSAAVGQQEHRAQENKKNDISFILNPMATEFLRDVCKHMKHIVVEGHGHWSDGTTGMCMPTSSSAAARFSGQQAQKRL
jgi:hypothetical protein